MRTLLDYNQSHAPYTFWPMHHDVDGRAPIEYLIMITCLRTKLARAAITLTD